MGALRREAVVHSLSEHLFTVVRARSGEVDARRLAAAWAATRESLSERLLLDEELYAASIDLETTLDALAAAGDAEARQRAVADLHHHVALLEDLLASSPLPHAR